MKTGEDCRYLWVFWSGLVVCWSAGPGGSAPQTKLGSWGGLGLQKSMPGHNAQFSPYYTVEEKQFLFSAGNVTPNRWFQTYSRH